VIGTFRLHYAAKHVPGSRWGLHHEQSNTILYVDDVQVLVPSRTEGPTPIPAIPSFVLKVERAQLVYLDLAKKKVALVSAPKG
jgi:hypothetical protein